MKALFSRALLWTLTLAVISWPEAPADAQVRYGSIVVEARDPSGSAVPGADVTITETGTNPAAAASRTAPASSRSPRSRRACTRYASISPASRNSS